MSPLTMILVFLCVFFLQFNEQAAARIYLPSVDDNEDHPIPSPPSAPSSSLFNAWYNKRFNDLEDNDQQEFMDHLWKRFSPELVPLRQTRRFGNTRYGRSLPKN